MRSPSRGRSGGPTSSATSTSRARGQADVYGFGVGTEYPARDRRSRGDAHAAHTACFAAGTLVHTVDGPRAIESIQVGDRVLSQDTSKGYLAFRPVVAVHTNGPSATLRIAIGGETIVATGIHRFWKAGKGWIMARELKAGDRLRMIGDVVEIQSIEPDATQPVYNLDVAENRDFFVGTKGLLVHDFSFVQPVLRRSTASPTSQPRRRPVADELRLGSILTGARARFTGHPRSQARR